jgi:hypothetical protein
MIIDVQVLDNYSSYCHNSDKKVSSAYWLIEFEDQDPIANENKRVEILKKLIDHPKTFLNPFLATSPKIAPENNSKYLIVQLGSRCQRNKIGNTLDHTAKRASKLHLRSISETNCVV